MLDKIVGVNAVRVFVAFAVSCLAFAQVREGNFDIRFEPDAKLQTNAPIPYRIAVRDALNKPLPHADVLLRIETPDHQSVQSFKAPMTDPGIYVAKPVFPRAGQWHITVDVTRSEQTSSRTITYTIPD